jgi:hypothetical protein
LIAMNSRKEPVLMHGAAPMRASISAPVGTNCDFASGLPV